MGRILHLEQGVWNKSDTGTWHFVNSVDYYGEAILVRENESFEDLSTIMRVRLELDPDTPLVLTYKYPEWILGPNSPLQPVNILETSDVEVMMGIREFDDLLVLHVTFGPENVARYQFLCRTPFTTELSGRRPVSLATQILELVCDQKQLLGLYRLSMEIDLAHSQPQLNHDVNHDRYVLVNHPPAPGPNVDVICNPCGTPISNPINNNAVFGNAPNGLALSTISPIHSSDILRGASLDAEHARALKHPHRVFADTLDDANTWEALYNAHLSTPANPLIGRPLYGVTCITGTAPPLAPSPDMQTAYTGERAVVHSFSDSSEEVLVVTGDVGFASAKQNIRLSPQNPDSPILVSDDADVEAGGPSLDLSLGIGCINQALGGTPVVVIVSLGIGCINQALGGTLVVVIDDSSSEVAGETGGFGTQLK